MLPKIIFCESHYDSISAKILSKIAPKLKNLGYEIYYDEAPKGYSLARVIDRFNNEKHKEILKKKNELFPWINNDISSFTKEQLRIINFLKKAQAESELGEFFSNLQQNGLEYYAMDLPTKVVPLFLEGLITFEEVDRTTPEAFQERDQYMTNALLSEKRATFSCIGAQHALGIQNKILEKIPQEQAISSFYFVNIYRDSPIVEYESKLRKGEIRHPLGMHFFDANKLSEDEIMDSIIQNSKRLAQLNIVVSPINDTLTLDPKAHHTSDRLDALKLDGLTELDKATQDNPESPLEQATRRLNEKEDQQRFESFKISINLAVRKYCEFLDDKTKDNRGAYLGFFTRFRHGEAGRARAIAFEQQINATVNSKDALKVLSTLLDNPDTRYHNHSFATYLLDELNVTLEEINPECSLDDRKEFGVRTRSELESMFTNSEPSNSLPLNDNEKFDDMYINKSPENPIRWRAKQSESDSEDYEHHQRSGCGF